MGYNLKQNDDGSTSLVNEADGTEVLKLDVSGNVDLASATSVDLPGLEIAGVVNGDLTTEAGTGITTGTGTVYQSSVSTLGGIKITRILIDITGLNSNVVSDIIGVDATANCHIGQITAAQNGTIFGGRMECLEAPATGEPDIDLFAADESTGTEDTAITALTNDTAIVTAGADWTLGLIKYVTAIPAADQYLYLVGGGGTTDATYTAGKFLIELYGV